MGSKTAPAYILSNPKGGPLSDEQRKHIVDAAKASGGSDKIIVEELPDGTPMLLHDPRPKRTLYHYTSQRQWERVQQDGFLRVNPQGFVALTDEPNLRPASPNAHWATAGPLDKTQVRITVITHEADPFTEYCEHMQVDPEWIAKQIAHDSPEHWFVLDRPITAGDWVEVRMGDTPVAKRPLAKRRRTDRPMWQTSGGHGSRCDFCGMNENAGACYRYECRPYEVGTWHNGNPYSDDLGEADWAACWMCAELIQQRDIKNLLARSDHEMASQRVISGGKHGTNSGIYVQEISDARIIAFFQHYTKRRWFVGKCDFCSIRGESVRWQYDCGAFKAMHPMNDVVTVTDTPWCLCEACAKLVERNKQKGLIERALEYQFALVEQADGYVFTAAERARARMQMADWVGLFFKHKRGARHPIADLPPTREIPQAPVAAQGALDEQMTLLRWLEGSDGRKYLGGWNDSYQGNKVVSQDQARAARQDELMPWTLPLRYGEAFYWEPITAGHIRQAAAELRSNKDVPFLMQPQILPAPYGFFYTNDSFGEPVGFPCRAVSWAIYNSLDVKGRPSAELRSTVISLWPGGGGDPSQADGIILTFWSNRPQDSVLRPSAQLIWQFGLDYRKVTSYTDEKDGQRDEKTTMVAALFQFIQQRIVITGRGQPVSSAIRKRIEREYPDHLQTVRVITLRRVQRADYQKPDEPSGRSLSYQFKVHGFWRNQCFNTAGHAEAEKSGVGCNDHMTIYVHDFWKGPADAPELPEAQRVSDVAR